MISEKGQALVSLLVFVAIGMMVTVGAVTVTLINSLATSRYSLGEETLRISEAGVDNAILRLLRNPSYSGETLTLGQGSTVITLSGTNPKTIVSEATVGSFRRKIQVVGTYANNSFTITSWVEID